MIRNYEKTKSTTAKAYSKIAPNYNSGKKWYEKDGESIDRFLSSLVPNARILSIGCGKGELEGYVASKEYMVTAVDIAPGMIESAKMEFPEVTFQVMDADELDFSENSFDAVICRYMSQHVDLDRLLAQISRVTKSDGKCWLMLHTALDTTTSLEFGWEEIEEKAIMWLPSSDKARELIQNINMEVTSYKSYPDRSKMMNDELYVLKV